MQTNSESNKVIETSLKKFWMSSSVSIGTEHFKMEYEPHSDWSITSWTEEHVIKV